MAVRDTPQQNGVAERYNRTLMGRTVALLADRGQPKKWWAEAAATVTNLGKRVPHNGRSVTPYEAMFGQKPDVGHLRVFGFRVWMHVPAKIRRKLEPRAAAGILLGFGIRQKGWRVLLIRKVEVSRDVRFLEELSGQMGAGRVRLESASITPTAPLDAHLSTSTCDAMPAPGSDSIEWRNDEEHFEDGGSSDTQLTFGLQHPQAPIADAIAAAELRTK